MIPSSFVSRIDSEAGMKNQPVAEVEMDKKDIVPLVQAIFTVQC